MCYSFTQKPRRTRPKLALAAAAALAVPGSGGGGSGGGLHGIGSEDPSETSTTETRLKDGFAAPLNDLVQRLQTRFQFQIVRVKIGFRNLLSTKLYALSASLILLT